MERQRRILVVDDEPLNRELIGSCLGSTYEISEAEDGLAALEALERAPVDLVLLDVMTPRMNGFDACRAIKERPEALFLPVILLTALNSQEDRNLGLAAGADEFLSKPIDQRELTLRVRALLRLRDQDQRIREQLGELKGKKALIHAQLEQLEQLQDLKDDLFSLIVHDLRNPLSGVIGYLGLLQEDLADPSQALLRRTADRAREAADQLQSLLEDVLEVRRLEAGGVRLRIMPSRPLEIVRSAVRSVEGAAADRSVAIEVSGAEDAIVPLDPKLVRRAIENLLTNAISFSPPDGRILASARVDGQALLLEVADEGPGVSDSGKLKLFKKFSSASPSGGGRKGFGLGLHQVKLVASTHGGEAIIRDRPEGGAVFGLSLPFVPPGAGPSSRPGPRSPGEP